ncbi:MAG: hemolysin III family protein [Bacteroidales bacterium]|nr:hemolysin III family protein [Bacteroidales bacterium]
MINREEFANALIHGIGAVFFIAAAPFLFYNLNSGGDQRSALPVLIYVFCLLFTYFASTVYHTVTLPDYKKTLRILDHVSIFLLIGGTFTPIVYFNMGAWNGWPFLITFWSLMIGGVIFKIFFTGRFKLISTLIYVGVAWFGAMMAAPIYRNIPKPVLIYLLIGGLFYTSGTFFYMQKRMKYNHAIWHLFVLVASLLHFYAVLLQVRSL